MIAHATREGLVSGHQRLPNRIQLPGSAPALLELRLGEAGRDALGFAVQVPHYLAQAVYPPAALALLGAVTTSTGLDLPDAELREAAERTNEAIERQVAESEEVAELVRALEQQYDTAAETSDAEVDAGGLLSDGEAMPTADELAAQFERFLAEHQGRIDPPVLLVTRDLPSAYLTTTSSRGVLLSRSKPPSVQTTMSSILAPCGPG